MSTREHLTQRYELIEEIGRGGQGQMFLAQDRERDDRVAIKKLAIDRIDNWKALELFEREGRTLEQLEHPAIPRYIDAFSIANADGGTAEFYLVQEFVDGTDFSDLIEQETRFTEEEVRDVVRAVLEVLQYLQSLNPPIIHRDLKPSNLIRRPDGTVALVDFGAIQATLPHTMVGGSTIIGTSGYMPHEQFIGRAVPATDLYSLAATAVHLLSGIHPSDLPVERMRLGFQDVVTVSPEFEKFLGALLEPSVEDRPVSAADALALMDATATALVLAPGTQPVVWDGASRAWLMVLATEHVASRSAKHLTPSVFVAVAGETLPMLLTGIPVVSSIAYVASSILVIGVAGWLGARVLDGHPALLTPSNIDLRSLARPALWLAFWAALASSASSVLTFGYESLAAAEILGFLAQSAFFSALMVLLGFTAGCAYRLTSDGDSSG